MNRLEFICQIHRGRIISVDNIIRFFDHTMAAYNIIGDIKSITINNLIEEKQNSLIRINANIDNQDELNTVVHKVNKDLNNCCEIYNKEFNLNIDINSPAVELTVSNK